MCFTNVEASTFLITKILNYRVINIALGFVRFLRYILYTRYFGIFIYSRIQVINYYGWKTEGSEFESR
jgi:hypothetical protein